MSDETVEKLCGIDCLNDLEKKSVTAVMYNQSKVKPLGKKHFRVTNSKKNKKYSIEFHIVGEVRPCKSILGLRASKHPQLLTINEKNTLALDSNDVDPVNLKKEDCISLYKAVFSEKDKLAGQLHLEIDKNVHPVELPTRGVLIALKKPLKQGLDRPSNIGMIEKVDTSTEWISALVITTKKNDKVRLCIDPKPLNKALHRNHYPLPIIDDVHLLLSKARVFTVLDAKNGFWHIQLDKPSSYATTFGTPWGRYRWLRMPFGLFSCSRGVSEEN